LTLRQHCVRYYPRQPQQKETVSSLLGDLAEFAPDVVHFHSYYSDLPYPILATVSHLYPTCFTPHDPRPIGDILTRCWDCEQAATCLRCPLLPVERQLNPFANPYFRSRLRKRYTHWRASKNLAIVAVSVWMQNRLTAQELKRFKIYQIPNGIILNLFHPIP